MFKRSMLVILSLVVACMFFAGCQKKAEDAAADGAKAGEAAAPAGDAAAMPAPAPGAPVPPAPGAPVPPEGAPVPPEGAQPAPGAPVPPGSPAPDAAPLPPVPPEAQAAVDKLLEVLSGIAAAGEKETCADVLAELKKLDTPETKAKLEASLILQKYPEDVQRAINQANQGQMLAVAFKMAAYQKCQNAPENDQIDAMMKQLLAPIAPAEGDNAEAEAPAAEPAAAAAAPAPAAEPAAAAAAPAPAAEPAAAAAAPAPAAEPAAAAAAPAPAAEPAAAAAAPAPAAEPAAAAAAPAPAAAAAAQ